MVLWKPKLCGRFIVQNLVSSSQQCSNLWSQKTHTLFPGVTTVKGSRVRSYRKRPAAWGLKHWMFLLPVNIQSAESLAATLWIMDFCLSGKLKGEFKEKKTKHTHTQCFKMTLNHFLFPTGLSPEFFLQPQIWLISPEEFYINIPSKQIQNYLF